MSIETSLDDRSARTLWKVSEWQGGAALKLSPRRSCKLIVVRRRKAVISMRRLFFMPSPFRCGFGIHDTLSTWLPKAGSNLRTLAQSLWVCNENAAKEKLKSDERLAIALFSMMGTQSQNRGSGNDRVQLT